MSSPLKLERRPLFGQLITAFTLVLILTSCKQGAKPLGVESGKCSLNKTCNAGLTCLSGVCVKVPDDFCQRGKVAEPAPSPGKMINRLDNYKRQAMAVEANANLKRIKAGARQFFVSDHYDTTGRLLPRSFPVGGSSWSPANTCCQQTDGRCISSKEVWGQAPWRVLRFGIYEPHRFQYRYTSRGQDRQSTFTAEARADLDCDGQFSSYRITGSVDSEYNVVIRGPEVKAGLE